jgi:hypothetical protein
LLEYLRDLGCASFTSKLPLANALKHLAVLPLTEEMCQEAVRAAIAKAQEDAAEYARRQPQTIIDAVDELDNEADQDETKTDD